MLAGLGWVIVEGFLIVLSFWCFAVVWLDYMFAGINYRLYVVGIMMGTAFAYSAIYWFHSCPFTISLKFL